MASQNSDFGNKMKFIALSGTTGVTVNLYVYEYGNDMIVVDCGVGFPESDMFGVDLVIPDFSYIKQNINKLKVHLDSILTMKNKLIRQLTGGEETIGSNHKNWTKFVTEYNKVIVQEVELTGITKIKKESIDLANAPTPPEGKKINLQGFIATLLAFNVLE